MSALYRTLFILFVALLCLPGASRAQGGPSYAVEIDTRIPRGRALLEKYLELVRRQKDDDIDREQLDILVDRAIRQTRTLLATEGFFAPDIDATIDDTAKPWRVRLVVEEGRPVRIRRTEFSIVGAGAAAGERFYEAQRIDERWPMRIGERFRQEEWDATKNTLLREFRSQMFPEARIAFSSAQIDPDARTADLRIEVEPGDPRFFGDLRIDGLQRYTPDTVRNLNRELTPGAPFEQARLLAYQSALQGLPYFRDVGVVPVFGETDADGRVPLLVNVKENPERIVTLGAGISSNTGVRTQLGYTHLDLLDRSWRWTNTLRIEQREQAAETSVALPTNPRGWDDSVRAQLRHTDIENLDTRTAEIDVRRARLERGFDRAFGVRYVRSDERAAGGRAQLARALIPYWTWTRRLLDDYTYPRDGDVINVQLSGASDGVLADTSFVRGYARWVHLFPIGDRDSFATRLEAGYVLATTRLGIPQDQLFRAGGDASIRGYGYQSIGIREGEAVVGGRYLGIAGVEYTHWFSNTWGAGIFVDSGTAFDDRNDARLYTGYGVGPRWRSPVGPINLDVAYGHQDQRVRVHFSLGIVF